MECLYFGRVLYKLYNTCIIHVLYTRPRPDTCISDLCVLRRAVGLGDGYIFRRQTPNSEAQLYMIVQLVTGIKKP